MNPIEIPGKAAALQLLSQAQAEPDDVAYAMLVCRSDGIAKSLENSCVEEAVSIWKQIAQLDGDRARMWDVVDHAKRKLHGAGVKGLPTIDQEYESHLAALSPEQRCFTQVRHFHRVVMSARSPVEVRYAATKALELLAEYEQSCVLTKEQATMKLAFLTVLQRSA